ncbi:MAG: NPCBM/NEW2 domain-containing protein [Mycobacteriales bacterium]
MRSRLLNLLTTLSVAAATAVVGVATVGAVSPAPAVALDNGLALTPPMGFNDWNAFGCDVSEQLIKDTADLFVAKGLKAAGYQYVNIDDCWLTHSRDPQTGRLVPDPVKFPDGIKGTADYVHGKGLKLGIYEDAGTATCAGYPGSLGHEDLDAQTFADWGVDYLKYDNCNNAGSSTQDQYIARYSAMRDALAKTGRPIVYSLCEWGVFEPWTWAGNVGNLWRTTGDINDSWNSLKSIIAANLPLYPAARPGAWNDPDMLEVGNGGMTDTEYRTHFAMWSMLAAPLLIGTDLRRATPATYQILTNTDLIAIDQDALGKQAKPVATAADGTTVLARPLKDGDVAVALYNPTDSTATIRTTASAAGLGRAHAYRLRDVWQHTSTETAGVIAASVPAHGTVVYRVSRADHGWAKNPPATDLSIGLPGAARLAGQLVVKPGQPIHVSTALANHGLAPVTGAAVTLTGPANWTVAVDSSPSAPVIGTDRALTTRWTLTPPAGAATGTYGLSAAAVYRWSGGWLTTGTTLSFLVAAPPPAGASNVSDLTWLSASNAWGPVEKDTSNGEASAGDGHTITINGVTYAKGLGTNAPSEIDYFLGGSCSTVSADVGIDDEKDGSVANATFQIWADGTKVADSGAMTAADPARHLSAPVAGAQLLRLVADDNGDANSDHTDWAGPQLTCTGG